ncbi:DUF3592 domain-containing protein [Labrys neptuniae]
MVSVKRARGRAALPIVGRTFLILGFAGLLGAPVLGMNEWRSPRSASAPGTIVATDPYPVISFATPQGNVIRFTNITRSSLLRAGDSVTVAYNPAIPTDAALGGLAGRWFFTALAAGLGAIFMLVGGLLTLIGRKQAAGKR